MSSPENYNAYDDPEYYREAWDAMGGDFDAQSGDPCGCKICVADRKREEELKAIADGDDPPESEKDALFIEPPESDDDERNLFRMYRQNGKPYREERKKDAKQAKGCGDSYLTLANEYHPDDILPRGSSLPHANHPKNCNCDLCLGE